MHQNFINLKEEKRNSIINAALDEFSSKGYTVASTNAIVTQAGISKGALYHYFGSKKNLFLFLCDYVMDLICMEYYEKIELADGDIIARLRQACLLKMQLFQRHPRLFDFAKMLAKEDSADISEQLHTKISKLTAIGYDKLMNGLDDSLYKEGISSEKMLNIIIWVIEGYGNRCMTQIQNKALHEVDMDTITVEFDSYLDMLRNLFYR